MPVSKRNPRVHSESQPTGAFLDRQEKDFEDTLEQRENNV